MGFQHMSPEQRRAAAIKGGLTAIPRLRARTYASTEERFWRTVRKADGDGCWEWVGLTTSGYGQFHRSRRDGEPRSVRAHRWSYARHFGPIPDGLLVCHRCDNPRCVRPDHLFLGTHADNQRDAWAKGRKVAVYAGRTHCKNGHEFTPENTYLYPAARHRACRTCRTRWLQQSQMRRAAHPAQEAQ